MVIMAVVFVITLGSVPRSGAINFIKDVFRAIRSEVHLALFMLHRSESGIISPMQPIVLVTSKDFVFIAHAAGAVNGNPYQNSIEGLNSSFIKGCKYMEMDFDWTTEQQLVATHGWENFFGDPVQGIMNLEEFKKRKRSDGSTQMTFEDVDKWLLSHPGVSLITDVKANNLGALVIFRSSQSYRQIIPQVYSFMEFSKAKKMGFKQIILTNYVTSYSNSALLRFAEQAQPAAITVPTIRLNESLIASLAEVGTPVFTHPVSHRADLDLLPKGIKGIYSSTLCNLHP